MEFEKNLKGCKTLTLLEATWEAVEDSEEYEALTKKQQKSLEEIYEALKEKLEEDVEDDYPSYDHNKFKVASRSWQELNPNNLPYFQWLEQVALPMFWIQPNSELQHKLMSICCAFNSSAIPAWNHQARKEAQIPILYFYGESGSGKTEGNKLIAQSYNFDRWALVKADSSGASLRNTLNQLCFKGECGNSWDADLYPALVVIDNYEPKFMEKWGEYKTLVLSVIRSQSKCSLASKEGGNITFWGHALKSFTSVVHPKAMDRASSEFYRRFVFFYTAKNSVQSMGNWDFSDIPAIYRELWSPKNVYESFYPILQSLLTKDDDSTAIPFHRWHQTLTLLAVGVHCGSFGSISEGIDFFVDYWKWIDYKESQTSSSIDIVMSKIIDEALDFHYKARVVKQTIADDYPSIDLNDIIPRLKKLLPDVNFLEKTAVNYLILKGWTYSIKAGKAYYELKLPLEELYPMSAK